MIEDEFFLPFDIQLQARVTGGSKELYKDICSIAMIEQE